MLIGVDEYSSTYRPTFRGTVGGLDSVSLEELSSVQTSVHDSQHQDQWRAGIHPVKRGQLSIVIQANRRHGDQERMRITLTGAQPWTHKDKADNVGVVMLEDGSTFKCR